VDDGRVAVSLRVVARPGQALQPLAENVRTAVTATVERFLGLNLAALTVIVDGVGG
jgi:uncharacterized alkaline shock family protein YloU